IDGFEAGRLVYEAIFQPTAVESIDLHGKDARKLDLNTLDAVWKQFDVCINNGTFEHLANDLNAFRLMHEATRVGGLMIHEAPFTGWIDHGFRCYQPTTFWDYAAANDYKVELMATQHLSSKSVILIESREQIHDMAKRDQL